MKKINFRIGIYSRKSVYSDRSESTENQIRICKQYLSERFPHAEISVYEDNGFSAKNMDRPQFSALLRDLRGGKLDAVICYRLDRISRSVSDFAKLVEEFARRDVALICVREQFDTASPMGKAMMYISSVFAQLERETIAERVRDNMMQLARGGKRMGGAPPTGYLLARREDGKAYLRPTAPDAAWVRECFHAFLLNGSLRKTAEKMGKVTPYGLRGILENPVYCPVTENTCRYFAFRGCEMQITREDRTGAHGFLPYNRRGNAQMLLAAGEHTSLVGEDVFILTQEFLKMIAVQNDYALLSGVITCGRCGKKMSAQRHRDGSFRYRCKDCMNACDGITADAAAEQILQSAGIPAKTMVQKRIYLHLLLESVVWDGETLNFRVHRCTESALGNDRCREPENL